MSAFNRLKPTLVITRGYPGCGKSTFAREWVAKDPEHRVRLNRDDTRHMMFGAYWGLTHEQERAVTTTQQSAARAHLRKGRSVIIDDTNLRLRVARGWADIAVQAGAEFVVKDFEVSADVCIIRDEERADHGLRAVGPNVVRDFAQRYPMPWPEVKPTDRVDPAKPAAYVPDVTKPQAWIVDIDGTLAHHTSGRSPYDWSRVIEDSVDPVVRDLVWMLSEHGWADIIIVSGRDGVCYGDTEKWLNEHLGDMPYTLYMRKAGDQRPDAVVKAEIFDEHIRDHYNVIGVLDDRQKVVDMWRSMGLKCLQVQAGDF